MPDAFTPNADANNDTYKAYTSCALTDFELLIFDRWGTVVFHSTNQNEGWDGTVNGQALSTGVFVYKLSYNDGNFEHLESGSLTLIR